jgi:hypothetical protein
MKRLNAVLAAGAAVLGGVGPALAAGVLICTPDLPVFCGNLHVACAGRSRIAAVAFEVAAGAQGAEVRFAGGDVWQASQTVSESGRVLRPAGSRDWIRIAPDGRFSHRIYRGGQAWMSVGGCVRAAG